LTVIARYFSNKAHLLSYFNELKQLMLWV